MSYDDTNFGKVVKVQVDKEDLAIQGGRARAGDADRERYRAHLGTALSLGYIPLETYHARADAASAAVTVWELQGLISDLPPLAEQVPARARVLHAARSYHARLWARLGALLASLLVLVTAVAFLGTHEGHLGVAEAAAGWSVIVIGLFSGIAAAVFLFSFLNEHPWRLRGSYQRV